MSDNGSFSTGELSPREAFDATRESIVASASRAANPANSEASKDALIRMRLAEAGMYDPAADKLLTLGCRFD